MKLTQMISAMIDYRVVSAILDVKRRDRHPRTGAPFKNKSQVIEHLLARGLSVHPTQCGAFYTKYLDREESIAVRRKSSEMHEYTDAVDLNYMLMECIINLFGAIEAGAKNWSSQDILNHMLDTSGYLPRKFSPETFFAAVKQYDSAFDRSLTNAVDWIQAFRHGNNNDYILQRLEEMRNPPAKPAESAEPTGSK